MNNGNSKFRFIDHSLIYGNTRFINHTHPILISLLRSFIIFRFHRLFLLLAMNKHIRDLSTLRTSVVLTHIVTRITIQRNTYRTLHDFLSRLITYNTVKVVLLLYRFNNDFFKYRLWHCHFNNLLLINELGDSYTISLDFLFIIIAKNRLCLLHLHLFIWVYRLTQMSTQMR